MDRDAVTHDDDGNEVVPTSDSEWAHWVAATATRNHALKDPLLDWLDLFGESKGFESDVVDKRTDFLSLVFAKGQDFERAVVDHLRELNVGEIHAIGGNTESRRHARELGLVFETFEAMQSAWRSSTKVFCVTRSGAPTVAPTC